MLHFHIICLGKLKEKFWLEAEGEYLKRLTAFAKVTIHELKEISFSEKDPAEFVKQKEAEKIIEELAKIPATYVWALEEKGAQFNSPELAKKLSNLSNENNSFTFILGGPLGLHPSVVNQAHATLSLSPFTFTHQMARVILLEQLYRAQMIGTGRTYHY